MTRQAGRSVDPREMVDPEGGLVDRRGFTEPDIYELELERLFARAWLFVAHDSQTADPGDFIQTFMGEDRVIVVRDNDGQAQVLVNSCRHRGNAVCWVEEGHGSSFMCTYHGWTYDLQGRLVGVPGFKEVYHEELDRDSSGFIKAAQGDSYERFIFATMDREAPALGEYLGKVGHIGLGGIAARGEMQVLAGVQKYTLPCNWKFPVENGNGDWYHAMVTHASARLIPWTRPTPQPLSPTAVQAFAPRHLVLLGEYGHSISGPLATFLALKRDPWRESTKGRDLPGPVGTKARCLPGLFPNCWILGHQLCLSHPKGPEACEVWLLTLADKNLEKEAKSELLFCSIHSLGPGGMLEQDDEENWSQSSLGAAGTVAGRHPFNLAAGIGQAEVIEDESGPARAEANVNEHAQLWLHRNWSAYLAAESWAELKANHPGIPQRL